MKKAKVKKSGHGQGQIKLRPESVKRKAEHADHFEQGQVAGDRSLLILQLKNQKKVYFGSKPQNKSNSRQRQAGQIHAEKKHCEKSESHVHMVKEKRENHSENSELARCLVIPTAIRALRLRAFTRRQRRAR